MLEFLGDWQYLLIDIPIISDIEDALMITVEYDLQGKTRSEWQEELSYLWKVDDKEWLEQRKEEWKFLVKNQYSDNSASSNKKYMQFYVYGKGNDYIDPISRYLFIPIQSAAEAKLAFEVLFDPAAHREILNTFIYVIAKWGKGLPWLRGHVQYFVKGVLGDEYQEIQEKTANSKHAKTISPEPGFWFEVNVYNALKIINQKIEYHACVDCVPYFVSIIPYVTDAKLRKKNDLVVLLEKAANLIENSEGSELALEFANQLIRREDEIRKNWAMNAHLDVDD